MAAPHLTFRADLDAWVKETKERTLAVFKESTQRTVERAQDYISGDLVGVITGFLRASLRAADTPGIPVTDNKTGAPATYDTGSVTLAIAAMTADKPLYLMYGANYAAAVHNGTSKMSPRPWVALAALHWNETVKQVSAEAKARAGEG